MEEIEFIKSVVNLLETLKHWKPYVDGDEVDLDVKEVETNLLKYLWEKFGDIAINEDDELDEDFYIWTKGTDRMDVWHWFDARCPNCLAKDLMNL